MIETITQRFFLLSGARGALDRDAQPKVVTTTEISAPLVRDVGGDKVAVDVDGQGLPGSALRRTQAKLHPRSCTTPICWW